MSSATEPKALMTTAEYAAHRGASDSYVRRLRREGRLVEVVEAGQRLIDRVASDGKLERTKDPLRGGNRSQGGDAGAGGPGRPQGGAAGEEAPAEGDSLREAVRRERWARARQAELELGELSGDLIRRKDAHGAMFTLVRQALERLRAMGPRLRNQLANETDPRGCEALVDAEVRTICEDMQRAAAALAKGGASETPQDAAA